MKFNDLFLNAKGEPAGKEIFVLGISPLLDDLVKNVGFFADLLRVNQELKITFLYESESEVFNQSLFYDESLSENRINLKKIRAARQEFFGNESGKGGFIELVSKFFSHDERESVEKRISIKQMNLRQNVNLILADDVIRYCLTTIEIPSYEDYSVAEGKMKEKLEKFIRFLKNEKSGGMYISKYQEELIQMYDQVSKSGEKKNLPRGIYPRRAFYTLNYKRYSVWIFIFNRNGQVLLQQRSPYTADNRLLWDKSAGGHVDLGESSTIETARREAIEELFMPEAEYTLFIKEKSRDFIDFGEWNPSKRSISNLIQGFDSLDDNDWAIFRPVDEDNLPLTIDRKSMRLMHVKTLDANGKPIPILDESGKQKRDARNKPVYVEHIEQWPTRFISDVYLFVAPAGYMDTDEQMHKMLSPVEAKGAQSSHKLIDIDDLIEDVESHREKYTDDMYHMITEVESSGLLTQFSMFLKKAFGK